MHLGDDQAEDIEQRSFRRVLARHDRKQSLALRRCRALFDDRLGLSVSFVQCARKAHRHKKTQSVKARVFKVSLGDPHPEQAFAVDLGGRCVEIAGAAKCTAAVLDPFTFETPVCLCHDRILLFAVFNKYSGSCFLNLQLLLQTRPNAKRMRGHRAVPRAVRKKVCLPLAFGV